MTFLHAFRRRRFERGDVVRCWEPDRAPPEVCDRTVVVCDVLGASRDGLDYVVRPYPVRGKAKAIVADWMLRWLSLEEQGDSFGTGGVPPLASPSAGDEHA